MVDKTEMRQNGTGMLWLERTSNSEEQTLDVRLAELFNQSQIFPFDWTRDSILTIFDCMCWAGNNGMVIIFLTKL